MAGAASKEGQEATRLRRSTGARATWKRAVWKVKLLNVLTGIQRRSDAGQLDISGPSSPIDQRRELRAAFDAVDLDKSGSVSVQELRNLLQALGQDFTDAELRAKVQQIDADGSGVLEFDEFVVMMDRWQDEELRDIFNYFNTDGDGNISLDELRAAVASIGQELSAEAFLKMAATIDKDGSGLIDAAEFSAFMKPLMSFTQQHSFTLQQLPDKTVGDVEVVINTMGVTLSGHATVPFLAFALEGENVKPKVGLASCAAEGSMVRIAVSRKERNDDDELETVLLEARDANEAEILARKVNEAEARKNLRKRVAVNNQIRALKEVFDDVDVDGSGKLDIGELVRIENGVILFSFALFR